MITLSNISFSRGERTILDDISIDVKEAHLTVLLGPNGAGKSTLLKLLTGDLKPDSGTVEMNCKQLSALSSLEQAKMRAVMPQSSNLSFEFSAMDVALMGRTPHNNGRETQEDISIVINRLKETECYHLKDRPYTALSGGEQQRVTLARVLSQLEGSKGKRYLLMDEPVSNLDPEHQRKTLEAARSRADQGYAVFIIIHDLNLAASFADTILFLKDGKIHAKGSPHEVMTAETVSDVYNLQVTIQPHPTKDVPLVVNL